MERADRPFRARNEGLRTFDPRVVTDTGRNSRVAGSSAGERVVSPVLVQPRARVLVIDDDDAVREVVREILRAEGYRVATARDGVVALDLARDFQPAVILLDLALPAMDGGSFIDEYRHRARPPASVILFSGAPDIEENARHLRADGFVRKPFEMTAFLHQIGACMAAT
ncbi:MAG: response regulator [Chloroflexota bacterium]|nr:response regulator [Chloroflexota bacterium]